MLQAGWLMGASRTPNNNIGGKLPRCRRLREGPISTVAPGFLCPRICRTWVNRCLFDLALGIPFRPRKQIIFNVTGIGPCSACRPRTGIGSPIQPNCDINHIDRGFVLLPNQKTKVLDEEKTMVDRLSSVAKVAAIAIQTIVVTVSVSAITVAALHGFEIIHL